MQGHSGQIGTTVEHIVSYCLNASRNLYACQTRTVGKSGTINTSSPLNCVILVCSNTRDRRTSGKRRSSDKFGCGRNIYCPCQACAFVERIRSNFLNTVRNCYAFDIAVLGVAGANIGRNLGGPLRKDNLVQCGTSCQRSVGTAESVTVDGIVMLVIPVPRII